MQTRPVLLCILDGWGISDHPKADAVAQAHTPNFDKLMQGPSATLTTFGTQVGLPEGQMGNSEVGHMNIGAGRIVEMDLRRIDGAIERDELAGKPAIRNLLNAAKGKVLHLMGVLSDGGVHAQLDHLIALTHIADAAGVTVWLHLFTDGRDVAPKSALDYLDHLTASMPSSVRIATVIGRYYAMDRDNRWDRVKTAYDAIMHGQGAESSDAKAVIEASYAQGITDEFIPATVIKGYSGMADDDAAMLVNFRSDRARQLMAAIGDPSFDAFDLGARATLSKLVGMSEYSDAHNAYMDTVFPNEDIVNTLGAWLSAQGKTQFRIAETEKYPHVTFFFNGGVEPPMEGEERYLAPSPKVATYDLKPQMSAAEVTENLVTAIAAKRFDLLVVNYANPDMVGHTGDLTAATLACEEVDRGVGGVMAALDQVGGVMLLCADHGNCEMMVDPKTGEPHTAHTTNPVPVVLYGRDDLTLRPGGILADIAPTLLDLMGVAQPKEMTGKSLIAR
ncbi:MAG: 2,3-bisphosphoglycerate-independent phosphoglycerate mutase [Pseudomonadota bacterium]